MPNNDFSKVYAEAEAYAKKIKTDVKSETTKFKRIITHDTLEKLYKEAYHLFDALIDQYYHYETRFYYRHERGIGTQDGINLYRANNISTDYKTGVDLSFGSRDLAKYKKGVSKAEIWAYVKNGYRGFSDNPFLAPDDNVWSGDYKGDYFEIENANIRTAFDKFQKEADKISYKIAKETVTDVMSSGTFEYFHY